MAQFSSLFLLCVIISTVFCYDGMKIGDLSEEAAEELIYMLKHYPDIKINCTGVTPARSAKFYLYNRNNQDNPIELVGNNLNEIDTQKDVKIIIHGWLANTTNVDIVNLKNGYLKRYDSNVILVDWGKESLKAYSKAYCDVPGIARAVSQFLCSITKQLGMPLSKFHVLGHNNGGQIAGFAGEYVQLSCQQKIGRITGLDPSGPGFWLLDENQRLDPSDGEFVDVIHTDESSIGSPRNSGDVDFHPNCGLLQPGCPSVSNVDANTTLTDGLCSTIRSLEYMLESLTSNQLIGISCSLCARYCRPDIINEVYQVMGEECRAIPKPAYNFYIDTNDTSPYGLGWDPYEYIIPLEHADDSNNLTATN